MALRLLATMTAPVTAGEPADDNMIGIFGDAQHAHCSAVLGNPRDDQAIARDWKDKRLLRSIERRTHEPVASRIPEVAGT